MKTRTLVTISSIIVVASLTVLGRRTLYYLAGVQQCAAQAVRDRIPVAVEIARLNSMLAKVDSTIERRRATLVDMQIETEALRAEVDKRCRQLTEDEVLLQEAAALLTKRQETYVIGRTEYSFGEVDADARIKAERFGQDRELLRGREKMLADAGIAVSETRETLSNAEVERQRLAGQVQALETRATQLKTRTDLDTKRTGLGHDSPLHTFSDLERGISDLGKRLEKSKRLLDSRARDVAGITYTAPGISGLETIEEVLR